MTGQVASDEPPPISTSRQPVLPRNVTTMPLSRTSTQPLASSVWSLGNVVADERSRSAAGRRDNPRAALHGRAARAGCRGRGLQHGYEILGKKGLHLVRRLSVTVADTSEHGGNVPILAVPRLASLSIVPGKRRKPTLYGRDAQLVCTVAEACAAI